VSINIYVWTHGFKYIKVEVFLCGPEGSRRFRLPNSHDVWHMKVIRFVSLMYKPPLNLADIPGTHFH
jgi:hypothetical protein